MTGRNSTIDLIKCIAVIFVVFGHCIQYGAGMEYLGSHLYYDNFLFEYIYSFHMPLFAAVSGYLLYSSVKKHTFGEMLKSRISRLLVPMLSWQMVINVYELLKDVLKNGGGYTFRDLDNKICSDAEQYVVFMGDTDFVNGSDNSTL